MAESLCWFDTRLAFRTRSGARVEATPLDITHDHDRDPIVGLVARHAYVEIGFRFLMQHILQIALAPADSEAWEKLVANPPTSGDLRHALAPYRAAFILDDERFPAMQVRPTSERLAEVAKPKGRKATAGDEDEDDEGGRQPIAALLPDAPTGNVVKNDRDFFVKRDTVEVIGAGAILPVLYAHMVLFPPSGGGYFSLPHGIDSLKFEVAGDTLWRSIAANLLDRAHGTMGRGPWLAPCDATVFPWLDPSLPGLSLKKGHPEARRPVRRSSLHPAAIPLARRYRLSDPTKRLCDLTGIEGSGFTHYERWPNGLQYASREWSVPFVAVKEFLEWTGSSWAPQRARAKARADGEEAPADEADPEAAGPAFLKSRGPLRFDQWLELSLGDPPTPPAEGGKTRKWSRVLRPEVVSAFLAREPRLADELGRGVPQRSALARRTGFRLEATAAILDGKALAGFDRSSLALWWARDKAAAAVADAVRGVLSACHDIASALERAAKDATKTSDKTAVLCRQLHDGLLSIQDSRLAEGTQDMFRTIADAPDTDAANATISQRRLKLVRDAAKEALDLFDVTFPFATVDHTAIRIAGARRRLASSLDAIVARQTPRALTADSRQKE